MLAQSHTNKLLSKLLGRSVSVLSPALLIIAVLSFAVLSTALILPASATEEKLDSAIAQAETLSDEQMEKEFALPLDNLEDIGYTLQRVQQQAIDLYVEATRKRREAKVLSKSIIIPHEKLQAEGYYQPLRKAWLVFFVGTMEPLVQLLVHDVHDIEEHLSEVKKMCIRDRIDTSDCLAPLGIDLIKLLLFAAHNFHFRQMLFNIMHVVH